MTDVRIEDIMQAMSAWARQEVALKDTNRLLEARIAELTLLLDHGVKQMQEGFELADNPNPVLHLVIEEAMLAVTTRSAERVRTIASQADEIARLANEVAGLKAEMQECIDRMVKSLELLPNPHRTLRHATTEVTEMVEDAKKMVRENL